MTTTPPVSDTRSSFLDEVIAATPGRSRLEMCIQCGTCGGSCPSAADMDATPRTLFARIRAGQRAEVLRSNSFWYCVSCYYCMVRCPQEIHVTDVMYSLKRMSIREGYTDHDAAPDFSQTFVGYIEKYGRSFELGLATRYHLVHSPHRKTYLGTLALGMLTRDRLAFAPHRIKGMDELSAILDKAKALAREAELAGELRRL